MPGSPSPPELQPVGGTSLDRRRHYDQIALLPGGGLQTTGKAGVFDWARCVFREDEAETYAALRGRYEYPLWRTFQMSDHLPMWVEVLAR